MNLKDILIKNYPSKENQTYQGLNILGQEQSSDGYKQLQIIIDIENNEMEYLVIRVKTTNRNSTIEYEKSFKTLDIACRTYEYLK